MTDSMSAQDATAAEHLARTSLEDDLRERIRVLDERVAFAEQARDNAVTQRDEAKATSKAKGQRAGAEIGRLKRDCDAFDAALAAQRGLCRLGEEQGVELMGERNAFAIRQPPDLLVAWLKSVTFRLPLAHDTDEPFEVRGSGLTLGVLRPWLSLFVVPAASGAKPPTAATLNAP